MKNALLPALLLLSLACKEAPSERQDEAYSFKPANIEPVQPAQPALAEPSAPAAAPVVDSSYELLRDPQAVATRCQRPQDTALVGALTKTRDDYTRADYAQSLLTAKGIVQRCPDAEVIGHLAHCYEQLKMTDSARRYRAAWLAEREGQGKAIDLLPELASPSADDIANAPAPKTEDDARAEGIRQLKAAGVQIKLGPDGAPIMTDDLRKRVLMNRQRGANLEGIGASFNHTGKIDPKLLRKLQQKPAAQEQGEAN